MNEPSPTLATTTPGTPELLAQLDAAAARVTFGPLPQATLQAMETRPRGAWEKVKHAFTTGYDRAERDKMMFRLAIAGDDASTDDWLRSAKQADEADQDPRLRGDSWLSEQALGVVDFISPMASAVPEGLKGAGIGAATAAGAAALTASPTGPGAGAAALAAAPVGAGLGFGVGMTKDFYEQAAGLLYRSMREKGVPHEKAVGLAVTAAVPYAAIEEAQLGKMPGVKQLMEAGGGAEGAKKVALQIIKGVLEDAASSTAQEVAQDALVEKGTVALGQAMSGDSEGAKGTLAEIPKTAMDTAKQVAVPSLLLAGASGAMSAPKAMRQAKENVIQEELRKTQEKLDRVAPEAAKAPNPNTQAPKNDQAPSTKGPDYMTETQRAAQEQAERGRALRELARKPELEGAEREQVKQGWNEGILELADIAHPGLRRMLEKEGRQAGRERAETGEMFGRAEPADEAQARQSQDVADLEDALRQAGVDLPRARRLPRDQQYRLVHDPELLGEFEQEMRTRAKAEEERKREREEGRQGPEAPAEGNYSEADRREMDVRRRQAREAGWDEDVIRRYGQANPGRLGDFVTDPQRVRDWQAEQEVAERRRRIEEESRRFAALPPRYQQGVGRERMDGTKVTLEDQEALLRRDQENEQRARARTERATIRQADREAAALWDPESVNFQALPEEERLARMRVLEAEAARQSDAEELGDMLRRGRVKLPTLARLRENPNARMAGEFATLMENLSPAQKRAWLDQRGENNLDRLRESLAGDGFDFATEDDLIQAVAAVAAGRKVYANGWEGRDEAGHPNESRPTGGWAAVEMTQDREAALRRARAAGAEAPRGEAAKAEEGKKGRGEEEQGGGGEVDTPFDPDVFNFSVRDGGERPQAIREEDRAALERLLQKDLGVKFPVRLFATVEEARTALPGVTIRDNSEGLTTRGQDGEQAVVIWQNLGRRGDETFTQAARRVARHEAKGHLRLPAVLGKAYMTWMRGVVSRMARQDPQLLLDIAELYEDQVGMPPDRERVAEWAKGLTDKQASYLGEEIIAHLAEAPEVDIGLWDKIVAAVREGLRKMGWVAEVSANDVRAWLVRQGRAAGAETPSTKDQAPGGEARESRNNPDWWPAGWEIREEGGRFYLHEAGQRRLAADGYARASTARLALRTEILRGTVAPGAVIPEHNAFTLAALRIDAAEGERRRVALRPGTTAQAQPAATTLPPLRVGERRSFMDATAYQIVPHPDLAGEYQVRYVDHTGVVIDYDPIGGGTLGSVESFLRRITEMRVNGGYISPREGERINQAVDEQVWRLSSAPTQAAQSTPAPARQAAAAPQTPAAPRPGPAVRIPPAPATSTPAAPTAPIAPAAPAASATNAQDLREMGDHIVGPNALDVYIPEPDRRRFFLARLQEFVASRHMRQNGFVAANDPHDHARWNVSHPELTRPVFHTAPPGFPRGFVAEGTAQRIAAFLNGQPYQATAAAQPARQVQPRTVARQSGRVIDPAASREAKLPETPRLAPQERRRLIGQMFLAMAQEPNAWKGVRRKTDSTDFAEVLRAYSTPRLTLREQGGTFDLNPRAQATILLERPGASRPGYVYLNWVDNQGRQTLHVNSSSAGRSEEDEGGAKILYQALNTYAHNTGKHIEGSLLSPVNQVRRSVNMLMSLLRHERGNFLIPYDTQKIEGWEASDSWPATVNNAGAIAEAIARQALAREQNIDRLTYDPLTDTFKNDDNSDTSLSQGELEQFVAAYDTFRNDDPNFPDYPGSRRAVGVGVGTLKAVLVVKGLLQAVGRGEVVPPPRLRESADQGNLQRLFYSRRAESGRLAAGGRGADRTDRGLLPGAASLWADLGTDWEGEVRRGEGDEAENETRESRRQGLLDLGEERVGVELPASIAGLTPKYQSHSVRFREKLDQWLFYATPSEERTQRHDRLLAELSEETGLPRERLRSAGRELRQAIGLMVRGLPEGEPVTAPSLLPGIVERETGTRMSRRPSPINRRAELSTDLHTRPNDLKAADMEAPNPDITKETVARRMLFPFNGNKAAINQSLGGMMAAAARTARYVHDLTAGALGDSTTLWTYLDAQRKAGGLFEQKENPRWHLNEWADVRANLWKQLAAGKVQELITAADTHLGAVGKLMEEAKAAAVRWTNIEQDLAMNRIDQAEAERRRGLAAEALPIGWKALLARMERDKAKEALKTGGKLDGFTQDEVEAARQELDNPEAEPETDPREEILDEGQKLGRRTQSDLVQAYFNRTALDMLAEGTDLRERANLFNTGQPVPALKIKAGPEAAGWYVAGQIYTGGQYSLELAQKTRKGLTGDFMVPSLQNFGNGKLNPRWIFVDRSGRTHRLSASGRENMAWVAERLKDQEITQGDGWQRLRELVNSIPHRRDNKGEGSEPKGNHLVILDPPYWAAEANYDPALAWSLPALLDLVDSHLGPAHAAGVKIRFTNDWSNTLAWKLRQAGYQVIQRSRGSGDLELVAFNWDAKTGEWKNTEHPGLKAPRNRTLGREELRKREAEEEKKRRGEEEKPAYGVQAALERKRELQARMRRLDDAIANSDRTGEPKERLTQEREAARVELALIEASNPVTGARLGLTSEGRALRATLDAANEGLKQAREEGDRRTIAHAQERVRQASEALKAYEATSGPLAPVGEAVREFDKNEKEALAMAMTATYGEADSASKMRRMLDRLLGGWRKHPELPGNHPVFVKFTEGWRTLQASPAEIRLTVQKKVDAILGELNDREAVNPEVNRQMQAARVRIRQRDQRRRELQEAFDKAALAGDQQKARKALDAHLKKSQALDEADRAEVQRLDTELERHAFHLFRKFLVANDLQFRGLLPDRRGNPLRLPRGITQEMARNERDRLLAAIKKHRDRAAIEGAIQRHYAAMEAETRELERRNYLIPEELRNPFYVPHKVLDYWTNRTPKAHFVNNKPFRGYLEELTGSTLDIETDYLAAIYSHFYEVELHNREQDFVNNAILPYDVTDNIRERLQADEDAAAAAENRPRREISKEEAQRPYNLPAGHEAYQLDERLPVAMVDAIDTQKLADALGKTITPGTPIAKLIQEAGGNVKLTTEMIRSMLVPAEARRIVIPKQLASEIRRMLRAQEESHKPHPIYAAVKQYQDWWKAAKLFAPWTVVRYVYGNVATDLIGKMAVGNPRQFAHLGEAVNLLRRLSRDDMDPILREAIRHGVLDTVTGREAQKVRELFQLPEFAAFATKAEARTLKAVDMAKITTKVPELWERLVRLSRFLQARAELAGKGRDAATYGGAYWREVEAIPDSAPGANDRLARQAAKVARDTFVDYTNIGVNGSWLRNALVPFYSWIEGNFVYHRNLFRNALEAQTLGDPGPWGKWAGVSRASAVASMAVARLMVKLALPYVLFSLWNHAGDNGDDEEALSEADRRRLHLVLGRDDEGRVRVIYVPDATADIMEWVGGPMLVRDLMDVAAGEQPLANVLAGVGKGAVNKAAGSATPLIKSAYEVLSGQATFPDITDQKKIPPQDKWWQFVGSLTDADVIKGLRAWTDADYYPSRSNWDAASQWFLQVRRRDPQSWAYYSIRDAAEEWDEARTGSQGDPGNRSGRHTQVLRNFRRAIYNGDLEAAHGFWERLGELGYDSTKLAASIRGSDPLAGIAQARRAEFVDSLTNYQKWQLHEAYKYYAKLEQLRGSEKRLFPKKGEPEPDAFDKAVARPESDPDELLRKALK